MSRGHDRERKVKAMLEEGGWLVIRAAGSLGTVDLVAMRERLDYRGDHHLHSIEAMLIEVKSTAKGPYEHFGPADRVALTSAAEKAGAEAWLCWWPPRVREPKWIPSSEFPEARKAA